MYRILIIDDDDAHRLIYRTWLENRGYEVIQADNSKDGFELIMTGKPDCIILDYLIGHDSGFHMLHDLNRFPMDFPPVIFVSCAMDEALKRNATALGAAFSFEKSALGEEQLLHAVFVAIANKSLKA